MRMIIFIIEADNDKGLR